MEICQDLTLHANILGQGNQLHIIQMNMLIGSEDPCVLQVSNYWKYKAIIISAKTTTEARGGYLEISRWWLRMQGFRGGTSKGPEGHR